MILILLPRKLSKKVVDDGRYLYRYLFFKYPAILIALAYKQANLRAAIVIEHTIILLISLKYSTMLFDSRKYDGINS
jgi:hypothetical protein